VHVGLSVQTSWSVFQILNLGHVIPTFWGQFIMRWIVYPMCAPSFSL